VGRDSLDDIVTRYRLDGMGIESQWRQDFYAPNETNPGAHPASYTISTVSFPGVKWPGRGSDHPSPPSAEVNPLNAKLNPICHLLTLLGTHHILHVSRIRVKGRVQRYRYSPSEPLWPVPG